MPDNMPFLKFCFLWNEHSYFCFLLISVNYFSPSLQFLCIIFIFMVGFLQTRYSWVYLLINSVSLSFSWYIQNVDLNCQFKVIIDIAELVSVIFISILHLLSLLCVALFIFCSFSAFCGFVYFMRPFSLLSQHMLCFFQPFLVIAIEFCNIHLQLTQIHFQISLYLFTAGVSTITKSS